MTDVPVTLITGGGIGTGAADGAADGAATARRPPGWNGLGPAPEGVSLSAGQLAESIVSTLGRPSGMDVHTIAIRPIGQPAGGDET